MYTRPVRWEPGTFLRPCSECGIRYRAYELILGSDGLFRCARYCVEVPQIERDKIAAASNRRREAPPPPFGAPFVFKDAYGTEGALFNFLANQPIVDSGWTGGSRTGAAPADAIRHGVTQVAQGAYSLKSAGETMRYLALMIRENGRPTAWINRAKAKLRELADWAITLQVGFGRSTSATKSTNSAYGGVQATVNVMLAYEQGIIGYGFLQAYLLLGDSKYLVSARAVADILANMQAGGSLSAAFSSTDAAGTNRINYGTWTRQFTAGSGFDHVYQPDSLVCLEFLNLLLTTVGDELHGAPGAILGFSTSPQQLLSVSISNARAFWAVGAYDATQAATVNGLSATTPKEYFNSYPTSKGGFLAGTGSWDYLDATAPTGTTITAANWSLALRALFAVEGYSTQVSSVWTWLMSFASNPSFLPTTTSLAQDAPTVLSFNGTYNPKLALATQLLVRTPGTLTATAQNATNVYDWQCAGALAPIQGAQDSGSLDAAKDFVTRGETSFVTDYDYGRNGRDWIMLAGTCGLGGQMRLSTDTTQDFTASTAAVIGQMFRFGNKSFNFQV